MLGKRQSNTVGYDNDVDDDDGLWGYSTVRIDSISTYGRIIWLILAQTGVAIKWAVVGAILVILVLWLVLGRMHAQRRIRRGQRPMIYHKVRSYNPLHSMTVC